MKPPLIAICGSGTGVGKTHVACAFAREHARRGRDVIALKPVESGFSSDGTSDAARLAEATGGSMILPLYALPEPVSPHRAARSAGVVIELDAIERWVAPFRDRPCIVETAGGLLSPLSASATNLELIVRLEPDAIVLVAADRLGALHDVRACALALGDALWRRTVVALCAAQPVALPQGSNAEELSGLGWATRVVTFPHAASNSRSESFSAGHELAGCVDGLLRERS